MVIIMAVPNKERLNIDGRTDNGSSRKETDYNKKAKALINRILEYKGNYFIWMHDFSLPVDEIFGKQND